MLIRIEQAYIRYGFVSAAALAADLALFWTLLGSPMTPSLASGAGYAFGIAVHWLLSSRIVFAKETHRRGSMGRQRQKILFALSALLGLGITMTIVGVGSALGFDPRIAKLAAIAISFQSVWLVRRLYIFVR